MGVGMSRLNVASCGAFHRTTSELQDPSTYTRMMVDRNDHDNSKIIPIQGQKNNSSLPKEVVSSSLPKKDVVSSKKDDEEKNTYVNNIYQQLDEESEKNTDYDGPMFMKSPSFRDFMRPVEGSVKNGGKKKGEMRETNKTEAHYDYVCNGEACVRVESKNDDTPPVMNKEAGPRKDKKINKIFAQYYKPSAGVKNLFNPHPKHPKPSNSD